MNPPATNVPSQRLAIVALGSNLGDSPQILRAAIEKLRGFSAGALLESSLWETTPVDCPPGSPKFSNAVAAFMPRAGETPESLLAKLQALEKEFGRQPKKVLNEARPLDLDLVAFENEVRKSERLTLPHPRAHQRRFVLEPMSEVAPEFVLPGCEYSVSALLQRLPPDPGMRRLG